MTATATKPANTLPRRRAAFVRDYLGGFLNAFRAARDVGYATKSASVEGSRLLDNPDVQAEITRQPAILAEQPNVTPEKIVAELAVIAFSDLGDCIRINPDGTASIELGDTPAGATRAIASVDVNESRSGGIRYRIKLHDKHAALVSLAKMFGLMTGDGVNVSVSLGETGEVEQFTVEVTAPTGEQDAYVRGGAPPPRPRASPKLDKRTFFLYENSELLLHKNQTIQRSPMFSLGS
jgi:phage terminase small subunit